MSEKSEIASEKVVFMSSLAEAQSLTRSIADPRPSGDNVKAAISRAYSRLLKAAERHGEEALSYNRVRDFWNAERRARPRNDEIRLLRIAAKQTENEQAARNDLIELRSRMDRLERYLGTIHPNMDRQTLDQVRPLALGVGGADGAEGRALAQHEGMTDD